MPVTALRKPLPEREPLTKRLIDIADYTCKNAATFAQNGKFLLAPDEKKHRATIITRLADDLNVLASSALEGNALYSEFETILHALHRLGFFPEQGLVSAVARSIIGPAPRPDKHHLLQDTE